MSKSNNNTRYTAPRRGCAYEEEGVRYELFCAARILNFNSPRLLHVLGDAQQDLDLGEDEADGPLILEIPRKYLIEVNQFPAPTTAQLQVAAPTPTLDDTLRREWAEQRYEGDY